MSLLFIFLLSIFGKVYTSDIVFLIDSSPSVFEKKCNYSNLIRTFTSELVYELQDCEVNYASAQYNMKGYLDYGFSNNNSYIYNQMSNYKFKHGMPTLIHTGLQKIIDLYDHRHHNDTIFLILRTDGETLNVNDYKSRLKMYPFNSTKINYILLKISSTSDNQFVFDELNTSYSVFNCHNNSVEHILNSYNFCTKSTSTSTSTSTPTSITKTDTLTSLAPSTTKTNVTIMDTLISLTTSITNTVSSSTLSKPTLYPPLI